MKKIQRFDWLALAGAIIAFQAVGGLIGWVTSSGIDGWYQELAKAPQTPPDAAFGIVWTTLYILMAISVWRIWMHRHALPVTPVLLLFGLHMVVNWAWSFLFFHYHLLFISFIWIVLLNIFVVIILWLFYRIDRPAAYLLIPYLAWGCFAGYLSFYIWAHN